MNKIFVALTTALLFTVSSYADSDGPRIGIGVRENSKNKGQRDIASPIPECYISEGVLHVVSSNDWSYATVTLVETSTGMQSINAGFLDEGIEVYIPSATGNYAFTIVTESGDEFIGSFIL